MRRRLHSRSALRPLIVTAALLLAVIGNGVSAATVRVAVAANFVAAARDLGRDFSNASGHQVRLSSGATGQLYAQIANGAPYDVLLAADSERPARAVSAGLAARGSQRTYAIGRLVLVSAESSAQLDADSIAATRGRIAIANPETAPYGVAAMQLFDSLGVADGVVPRLVRGASVTQAYQFVVTGNAGLGLVARSLLVSAGPELPRWEVPASLHEPIRQDAVRLSAAAEPAAARAFLDYLASPAAAVIIVRHGYQLP